MKALFMVELWSVILRVCVFQDASVGFLRYNTGAKQAHYVPDNHRWRRRLREQPARRILPVRSLPAKQASRACTLVCV